MMKHINSFRIKWLLLTALSCAGCVNGIPLPPLPMPAWVPDRMEEKLNHPNDEKTPILPMIPSGFTPKCEDRPDRQMILRMMPRVARGIPFLYEEFRDDMAFVTENIADVVDPVRYYPLIGNAQLHHCHWKCTIYYTETKMSSWPFAFMTKRRRIEVIYIDLDHLHQYMEGTEGRARWRMLSGSHDKVFKMRLPIYFLVLLSPFGWTTSLIAQTPDRPATKFFGLLPAKPAAVPMPPLREDTNRLIEILTELAWINDPVTFPFYLEARVEGPNLKVRGNVPSQAVRDRALQLAKKNSPLPLADHLKINANLTFRPVHATPDQLQNLARAALREVLPRQAKSLQTRSSANGRIGVIGTVDSFEEKLVVSQALRRLRSCTVVVNLVKVASDPDGQVARSVVPSPPAATASTLPATSVPALDRPGIAPGNPPAVEAIGPTTPPIADKTAVEPSSPEVNSTRPPEPGPSDIRRLDLVQLQKRLEQLCPRATEIRVSITPASKLLVDIHGNSAAEVNQMVDLVLKMEELKDLILTDRLEMATNSPPPPPGAEPRP